MGLHKDDRRAEAVQLASSVLSKRASEGGNSGGPPVARGLAPILSPPSGKKRVGSGYSSAVPDPVNQPVVGVESPRDIHVVDSMSAVSHSHTHTHHYASAATATSAHITAGAEVEHTHVTAGTAEATATTTTEHHQYPPPPAAQGTPRRVPPGVEPVKKPAVISPTTPDVPPTGDMGGDDELQDADGGYKSTSEVTGGAKAALMSPSVAMRVYSDEMRELANLRASAGSAEGEIAALCDLLAKERADHKRTKGDLRGARETVESLRGDIALRESAAAHARLNTRALEKKIEDLEAKLTLAEESASVACFREGEMYKIASEAQRQLAVACSELERFHCIPPGVPTATHPAPGSTRGLSASAARSDLDALRRSAEQAELSYNTALQTLQATRTGARSPGASTPGTRLTSP